MVQQAERALLEEIVKGKWSSILNVITYAANAIGMIAI